MVDATSAGATPLHRGLPEEIVIWEILVLLPPKPLLRCRAVCRAWRRATSTHEFLLAHHGRQPSLPIAASFEHGGSHILAFDRRAAHDAQLHTVARLDGSFYLAASCDGLLVLSRHGLTETRFSICNPATRQHAPLGRARDLTIIGMYPHSPTGEYRLLLHRRTSTSWMHTNLLPQGQIGCYVFALGSGQSVGYIGSPAIGSEVCFHTPALVHDSLHWFLVQHQRVIVFDPISESFRRMCAPAVPAESNIFEMNGTLGICTSDIDMTEIIDIWVLQNYESEVWELKYRIKMPVAEIRGRVEGHEYRWDVRVVSGHGGVSLLVNFGWWLLHVNSDGKLVASFRKGSRGLCVSKFWLKQTLIPHTFFTALEGHVVNASPLS